MFNVDYKRGGFSLLTEVMQTISWIKLTMFGLFWFLTIDLFLFIF